MKSSGPLPNFVLAVALVSALPLAGCSDHRGVFGPPDPGAPRFDGSGAVLRVPEDFSTIQAAVNAADPGDVVRVAPGTYCENVVITTSDLRLEGEEGAVLNGTAAGCSVSGLGIGIHVLGTASAPVAGVEIRGLVVENFERGMVLENAEWSLVRENEVRNNTKKQVATPLLAANGIMLISAVSNEVRENFTHDNGHDGILLRDGSTGNSIRQNRSNNNGAQTVTFTPPNVGCGVDVVGGSNNNEIEENELLGNDWGVFISGKSSGNIVRENVAHNNDRAGVAVLDGGGNVISENDATGNGLANVGPSFAFDLFDSPPLPPNNTWVDNLGTSNF